MNPQKNDLKRKSIINLGDLVKKEQKQEGKIQENKLVFIDEQTRKDYVQKKKIEDSHLQLIEQPCTSLVKESVKFQFGNYTNYYNNRYEKRWQDPRLKILDDKDYFVNKEILDIGCNDGSLTLQIAIRYFPKKIIGLDIDYKLINKALENLRFLQAAQQKCKNLKQKEGEQEIQTQEQEKLLKTKEVIQKLNKLPQNLVKSDSLKKLLDQTYLDQNKLDLFNFDGKPELNNIEIKKKFPENVEFRNENYVQDLELREKFDTIICFSTVKWIHLNFGDIGVKRLFLKIEKTLRPGGYFIFEPQDWKSYKSKKNLCPLFKENMTKIQFKPNMFENFLVQLSFTLIRVIQPDESQEGFKRQIQIYQKNLNSEQNTENRMYMVSQENINKQDKMEIIQDFTQKNELK